MSAKKQTSRKRTLKKPVWEGTDLWTVHHGELLQASTSAPSVFKVIGEKLPWDCLSQINQHLRGLGSRRIGVYVAHDALGYPRYVGRGLIFHRLRSHKKAHPTELAYFSFYIIEGKHHQRDIETLLIRTAGPLLDFNDRKKRELIEVGRLRDYPGPSLFYERHAKKGKPKIPS